MSHFRRPWLALTLAACTWPALAAEPRFATLADLPPPPRPPLLAAGSAPIQATPIGDAQVFFLDPATGTAARGVPDAAALATLAAGMPRRAFDPTVRTGPTGTIYIDTSGLVETVTAVLGKDGTLHVDCGHAPDDPSHAATETPR